MATFFTRIRLRTDGIVFQGRDKEKMNGEFAIDVEELNISRLFEFMKMNPVNSDDCVVVISKDQKPFLSHTGIVSRESFRRYRIEEGLVLSAFYIIYYAYKGQLCPQKYALTKVQRSSTGVLVTASTPDEFRRPLMRACL